MHYEFESNMKWIRDRLAEDPLLMTTVRAAIEAKIRSGRGERLYRGDRNLGTVAIKHLWPCLSELSKHDSAVFQNMPDAGVVGRQLLLWAVGHGSAFKLPKREMLQTEFIEWVKGLAKLRGNRLMHFNVTSPCICGVNFGACIFTKAAKGELIHSVKVNCKEYLIPKSENL
eukprot:1367126-Lingulodinium_polyedra.AAC.1